MRDLRRMAACLAALILCLGLSVTASAAEADTGFSDVAADAWYAEAAVYCRDNGLMNGTTATTFSPNATMTRAQLCAVLYRMAGSLEMTGRDTFADTPDGAWYEDAVLWAVRNRIMSGYTADTFGPHDPVTREQLAAILWRYAGSPAAEAGEAYADEASIASWAVTAVDWARTCGFINGMSDGSFRPDGRATRAQVAAILMRYDQARTEEPSPEPAPQEGADVLVAYFSATGNTENIAEHLTSILDADLYEIVPEEPYTSEDLDYSNSDCRANQEQNDPTARPAISGGVENLEDYEVVFLGYPIWWGDAPKIISTFLETYDFDGKTIVPFCTSGSSSIGGSVSDLEALTDGATWLEGQRFSGSASRETVSQWVDALDLDLGQAA
mgnify:FL=1